MKKILLPILFLILAVGPLFGQTVNYPYSYLSVGSVLPNASTYPYTLAEWVTTSGTTDYVQVVGQDLNPNGSFAYVLGGDNMTNLTHYGNMAMNGSGSSRSPVNVYFTNANAFNEYTTDAEYDFGAGLVTGSGVINWYVNQVAVPSFLLNANGLSVTDETITTIASVSGTPTGTPAVGGGTVAAGANYAKIVAIDASGQHTTVSTETALVTTASTGTITWNWTAVTGAASYQIWVGSSSGTEGRYYTSATNSYLQTTPIASGTSGTMPTTNTTGTLTLGTGIAGITTGVAATAGYVGQVISSLVPIGSAVSLTTATPANMTSISLTAGDWDVEGSVNFVGGSATIAAAALHEVGFNTTTGTLPVDGSEIYVSAPVLVTTSQNFGTPVQRKVYNVSGATTVYLVAEGTFSAGTETVYGTITARRIR